VDTGLLHPSGMALDKSYSAVCSGRGEGSGKMVSMGALSSDICSSVL
jgi:hypothetical protein